LARAVRELTEPLRPRERGERIARLLDAITEHYRTTGEPEPEWLAHARERWHHQGEIDGGHGTDHP
jgi:uncharacterized alpha-E superfamily protein